MDIDKKESSSNKEVDDVVQNVGPSFEDVFPPWKEWGDRFTKLITYFRTRKAIYAGTPLWRYSREELEANNVLAPWTFNIYQSLLSSVPGIVLASVISFIFVVDTASLVFSSEVEKQAYVFSENIRSIINSIWIPISLFIVSFIAAKSSLKKHDSSPIKFAYARRAYLYFDGAYGLWSQMVIATITTLLLHPSLIHQELVKLTLSFMLIPAALWQSTLTTWKFPRGLFVVNGYVGDYPKFGYWLRRDQNSKLWRRYKLLAIFSVSIILFALSLLLEFIAYGAGYLFAQFQAWMQIIIT